MNSSCQGSSFLSVDLYFHLVSFFIFLQDFLQHFLYSRFAGGDKFFQFLYVSKVITFFLLKICLLLQNFRQTTFSFSNLKCGFIAFWLVLLLMRYLLSQYSYSSVYNISFFLWLLLRFSSYHWFDLIMMCNLSFSSCFLHLAFAEILESMDLQFLSNLKIFQPLFKQFSVFLSSLSSFDSDYTYSRSLQIVPCPTNAVLILKILFSL